MPSRPTMRLLSQRLRHLQHTPVKITARAQIRLASRYSQPTRQTTEQPALPASFITATHNIASADAVFNGTAGTSASKQSRREYHRKRAKFAAYGLALSAGGLVYSIWVASGLEEQKGYRLDASSESNATFQGKEVQVIGIGEGKRIVAKDENGANELDLVETGTSSVPHFPKTIYLPTASESTLDSNAIAVPNTPANSGNKANLEEYSLIGLGIRSVSFLSIQVYVVGLYIRTTDMTGFQARLIHHVNPTASTLIPSEKEDLKSRLLNAEESREIWNNLLASGMKTAWRIVPTRNTDFMHLRDGWITGINKRTAEAKKLGGNVPSEYDREDFGMSIKSFMSIFKGGKAPKGSVMTLSRTADGGLDVFFAAKPDEDGEKETQLLGSIGDERISKLIWMNYLAGDKVSSQQARQSVVDGCVALASRPVGSVETMVA